MRRLYIGVADDEPYKRTDTWCTLRLALQRSLRHRAVVTHGCDGPFGDGLGSETAMSGGPEGLG
jgi:hypothetical protein